ncbi:ATP-binding cassette domain-containing protein [Nonomuraea sp. NPDC059007]|uniref:ATP-binding cassette domain-containing protein n=1 Tax=Nonomuraea sp. NPDC059007 TaxID=3346692 RepID=UPI0036C172CA
MTIRLTLKVARHRIGLFSAVVLLLVTSNGLGLITGWLLQKIFDSLTGAASAGWGTYELIAVLIAVEAVRMGVVWGGMLWTICMESMRGLLRGNLLRAQVRGPRAVLPASSGEAISRFRDDVDDFLGFADTGVYVVGKLAFAAGAMTIMLRVDPLVAVAVVLPLTAMMIGARMAGHRIRSHRVAYRQASAAVTRLLGEVFGAVLAIKAAQAGDGVLRRLDLLNEQRRAAGLRDQLISALLSAFNRTTVDVSVGLVLMLAVPAMRRGDFTIGDLALFTAYTGTLVYLPHYGGRLLTRHRQSGVAIERLSELLPTQSPADLVARRPGHTTPPRAGRLRSLRVQGLTSVNAISGRGVHEVDLSVTGGTLTVVSGPAGAGKTTLLRALLGLLPAQSGTVWWNGRPVGNRGAFFIPPHSAYVPQVPMLFSESLRDNILLGSEPTGAGLTAALRTAVLDDDLGSLPDGLDTKIGARGVRLSGGQIQRAAIARALVRHPDLLVLDDVSSALDVETEGRLWDRLLADRRTTLLVVSNRPATLARADQVIELDHGRVRSRGCDVR